MQQQVSSRLPAVVMLALLAVSALSAAEDGVGLEWPTNAWPVSTPEAQGMSSSDLADGLQFALANNLNAHSVTVIRHGVIVLDAYFYPFVPETRHDVASVTKSVVALLIGLATTHGHLRGADQTLAEALEVDADAAKKIRLRDLLTMRSGFDCGFKHSEPELWEMRASNDWPAHAIRFPMIAEPGTRFGYCSPNFHLLSAAISSSTGMSALDFARQHLFAPLGIADVYWPADPNGITHGWGDLQLRPRDMAKIGLLMLRDGRWNDRQLLPKAWIDDSIEHHVHINDSNDYGLGWWMPSAIPGLFEATGRGGQRISMLPDKDVVVVITGGGFEPYDIGRFITKALRSDAPLPPDPASERKLEDVLRRISAPPAPRAAVEATAPKKHSGQVYTLEKNSLGVRTFAVDFADPNASALHLVLDDGRKLSQPLGMNGQYRMTTSADEAISAGRAEWYEDGRLRIDFNRLSRINRYIIDTVFRDQELQLVIAEPTEIGTVSVRGRLER